ncbi:MAG: hypothetical protein JSS27_07565 [Planctomycetes bacterium]|nr:hypothetical protein [Planctomycetota bacterium]
MTRINTNLTSLTAQINLTQSQSKLQQALTRLSTGLQINSGKDNPGGLIASQILGSEITSVNASISNSQQANNMLATADSALSQVSSLLNDVRGLVQQSANSGAITPAQISANQVQVDSDLQSILRIGQTTVFGGSYLLNGSKAFNVTSSSIAGLFSSTSDINVSSFNPSAKQAGASNDVTLNLTQSATQKTVSLAGDSQVVGGSSSLRNLSLGSSTRTTTTINGTALQSLSSNTRASRTITMASLSGLTGGAATVTLNVTGNAGSQSVTATQSSLLAGSGAGATYLAGLVNGTTASTGVTASVVSGNVVLNSVGSGTGALASVTATAASTDSTKSTLAATSGTTTDAGKTVTFSITNSGGTDNFTVDTSTFATASDVATAIVTAITGNATNTGVTAAVGAGNTVVITNAAGNSSAISYGAAGGTSTVGNKAAVQTVLTGATAGTASPDSTAFAAGVGSLTAGTNGTSGNLSGRTTTFTITGNKGSATISTAELNDGTLTGNDVITTDGASGLNALRDLINSRTGTTGVSAAVSSGNIVLTSGGVGSTSLATFGGAAGNASGDNTLIGATTTQSTATGVDGTSNQVTLQITGSLGSATITVNNDQIINDSSTLSSAINRVSAQTGVTASTNGGNLADVSLKTNDYGSAAVLTVSAISATNAADVTLLNGTGTQSSIAGKDVAGTVSTSLGTDSFTGTGAMINYNGSAITFTANTNAPSTQPTQATTTLVGTSSTAGAGINHLTGAGSDTIAFTLHGNLGGVATSTSITGVNVAALQGDSRVLVDAINKTSQTSGVHAAIDPAAVSNAGANIILTSTTPGSVGSASLVAVSSGTTQAGDVGVFNAAGSSTSTNPGLNAPASATSSFDVSGGALFQIGPTVNFTNQVTANIQGLDLTTLGRNVLTTGQSGISSLLTGGSNSLSASDLSTAATLVDQAISQIATLRGTLGALQKNVLDSNITAQQSTLEQLTQTQSDIQDADFAAETANLTRAQILVQAGTSVLSIANSQPQQVLALLPHG